ncbi:uncharacterized protein LOC105844486 isoform X2 [Hydra vulgaris]|uniref:uncharacterized protein LOC105844486 isoform X2 n=1 Tax=Hydra vulgaris TaxID=6087 RepID=UPI001F5EB896|nr:uncharacterized protein LOC105844486 isoform X2 [Hydra vulgaris]
MTSKKRAHAMVNLVKNPCQHAQYNKLFEDNSPVKSDEFMASFIKDNDIKNTTAKVSCFNIDIEGVEKFDILQNAKISCLDIDIDAIEMFEIVKTGTTCNNNGDCNTINILETSTAELTEDLNVDDIEVNSDITNDPSNKKNLKKLPTAMENRMFGQNYIGFRRLGKNVFQDTNRDCRKIKPRCNSTVCIKSKECNKLTEEDRLDLFNCFWVTTWDEKKTYIINLVTQEDTKRKTTGKYEVKSRRSSSYQYHLRDINETKIRVCKKMFLATLDLNEWMVHNWLKKSYNLSPKVYKKNVKNKDPETNEQINKIAFTVRYDHFIKWFDKLPKMESHYCRKRTKRLYLEGPFESKQQLYSLYVQEAKHVKYTPVSRACFNKFMKSKKFSIFKPRKDQCDLCCSYKTNQVTENEYQEHILNKDLAREQLKSGTEKVNNQENYTFTMDVQAVKLCPAMNASALYYSMKLKVHNFTIYNVNNEHQCHNCWWNECEGELDASVFVSILLSHLETYCINIDQEKKILFCFLMDVAIKIAILFYQTHF